MSDGHARPCVRPSAEIDENLCRAELTTAQRSAAIKRRREIWAAMHPEGIEAEQVVPPQSKSPMARPQETGFAAETSAAAGMTKQAINRHLARADALGDDLEAVVGTSLDKGVELDAHVEDCGHLADIEKGAFRPLRVTR